tara:strand:+ start:6771 stop:7586 length:816 start_codon:yes stop_codon:yes gene_type:complete
MKNLIYQYWNGKVKPSCRAGVKNMKEYADRIGVDHVFEENPNYTQKLAMPNWSHAKYFDCFKPVFENEFNEYDNILFCDTDVFAIKGLTENIFDGFNHDIGICDEPFQPKQRTITLGRITSQSDNKWANLIEKTYGGKMPRTEDGLVRAYNTGVVLYSRKGINKVREQFEKFDSYARLVLNAGLDGFYSCDQPYLHAMLFSKDIDILEMDNGWNSYVHGTTDKIQPKRRIVDHRNENTKFVHCQFPGADNMNEEQLLKIVNLPQKEWGYDI